ncbi:hypothetical protein [Desulfotomaculum sp. 1211_IL3151]|uniref:hypothetical protein n=1 Tax=Desulfotomaculum sp. 1211_IL3151 TaxID=3084055 RepID=UPI002FD98361
MRGFWNDDDGMSITDSLAIWFSVGFGIVSAIFVYLLLNDKLTDRAVDFFTQFSWPIITILGGYYGDKIASQFGSAISSRRRQPQIPQTQLHKDYDQRFDDYPPTQRPTI